MATGFNARLNADRRHLTDTFREGRCWSCGGHPAHKPGECKQLALFTKTPCECTGR